MAQARDEARAQLTSTNETLQQARRDLAAAQPARPPAATSPSPEAKTPTAAAPFVTQLDYVMDHPETHAAYLQQQVLRTTTLFDGFLATLPSDKQEAFRRTLKAAAEGQLDMMMAVRSQYGPDNRPGPEVTDRLRTIAKQAADNLGVQRKRILGDDLDRQFGEYAKTLPERTVLRQLGGQLYFQDSALTRDQGDQLVRVLAANRYSPQSNVMAGEAVAPQALANARMQGGQMGAPLDWAPLTDAAIVQAQAILTPAQIAALRQVQAQQVVQIQLAPVTPGLPAGPQR